MFKILIVEDEEKIRVELQNLLNRYGYEAMVLDDFHEVDHQILQIQPHLVLLDINLPEMDGYMICRSIRQQSSIPVLMVTSRSSDLDELMSMSLGADDFITKPYNVQILLAHIQAVLKRAYPQDQGRLLEVNGVTLDLSKGCVMHEHQSVELTKNEIRILWLLMRKQGTIVSRDEILIICQPNVVWGIGYDAERISSRPLDVFALSADLYAFCGRHAAAVKSQWLCLGIFGFSVSDAVRCDAGG